MAHPLAISDPHHPEHYQTCDRCGPLSPETEITIQPLTPTEPVYVRKPNAGMSRQEVIERCHERIDSILRGMHALAFSGASAPFGHEWKGERVMDRVELPVEIPSLKLTIDRIREPEIRENINRVLRSLGLRTLPTPESLQLNKRRGPPRTTWAHTKAELRREYLAGQRAW